MLRTTRRTTARLLLAGTLLVSGSVLLSGGLVPAAPAAAAPRAHSATRNHSAHTRILERRVIGYSVRHRPIVAYHLGDPHLARVSMILGQMHGNEHAGVRLVRSIVHGHWTVRGVNLWVVPTMNPDGNAADTRKNAHHVDLNRNWPADWARLSGQYNSGRHALSEPETRVMSRFLRRIRPHYLVSIHQPLTGVDTTDGGRLDPAFRNRLARNLGLPAKPFRCWSTCHGNMTRWYTQHHYGIGLTVEFRAHPSSGYLTRRAPRGIVAAMGGRLLDS